jgi:hypothetical protein
MRVKNPKMYEAVLKFGLSLGLVEGLIVNLSN